MTETLRLIVSPKGSKFSARLESTGEFVVVSNQRLIDGARELLARGFDPATPLVMRHEGKTFDSFAPAPAPIGEWAKVRAEGEKRGRMPRSVARNAPPNEIGEKKLPEPICRPHRFHGHFVAIQEEHHGH